MSLKQQPHDTSIDPAIRETPQHRDGIDASKLRDASHLRVGWIDVLRGLVIVLMVLDHARDFFHVDALAFDPTDLEKTSPLLFLTRWVTHLCAPTFVFLAGISVWLQQANGKTGGDLSRFLLVRGLWLIALELLVVSFAFNFALPFVFLQGIWAIGVGFVILAALCRLPRVAVLAIGLLIVIGHGVFAGVNAGDLGSAGPAWTIFMELGLFPFGPGLSAYPVVPWLGILLTGYGLGNLFVGARSERNAWILAGAALAIFAILRLPNLYGDPRSWVPQADPVFAALSVINVSKYPPSLQFVLLTIGVALPLGLIATRIRQVAELLAVFGRTPLFTYLLHVFFLHTAAVATGIALGVPASAFSNWLADPSRLIAAGWGVPLWAVYVVWALTVIALYPLARAYDRLKRARRYEWTSFL